jgi:YegS/Rv2252/BmrU family lipid kinase
VRTRFIVNPHSGGAHRVLARVQACAATLGAEIATTTHRRHATALADRALADGCELIVAVGGDGTLNEVAARLVHTPATLGLIPCGSGNGLGRHLGIHGPVQHSLEILRTGRPQVIDTGLADGHPFFNVAGLGFEADVAAEFNGLTGRGFARYFTTAVRLWRHGAAPECWIEHAGQRTPVQAFTVAVANSDQYGNQAFIAPDARVDDGLLDLTVVPRVTVWKALPLLVRLFAGSIDRAPGVLRLQGPRFVIVRPAPGLIHTDGETHQAGVRVEFAIQPRSLRVLVPALATAR